MYDVVFDESFSSVLAYTSQPYAEEMAMLPAVSYIPSSTSSREKTGNITTFMQFEEVNLLSENRDNTGCGNKYDEHSTLPPLFSKEEMDVIDSGNESDAEHMSP